MAEIGAEVSKSQARRTSRIATFDRGIDQALNIGPENSGRRLVNGPAHFSNAPKGFKRTNDLERVRQRGPANSLFESLLHLVESCNHA